MTMKLLFIGSQYLGHKPDDGETMKNSILSKHLESQGHTVVRVDTRNRPLRIWYLIKLLFLLLFCRKAKIVFSASSLVTYKLLRFAKFLGWKGSNIIYWVIGGNFGTFILNNKIKRSFYGDLSKIIVEGKSMEEQLVKGGLNNVMVLPNFKNIKYIPKKEYSNKDKPIRFVFISRVMPEKGVDYIINSSNIIRKKGIHNFSVDIYGKIEPSYKTALLNSLRTIDNVKYKGFLSLDKKSGFDVLSSYDVMLFPTYWIGEGFPGILIDSFIAGLPIIASDWNLNASLIKDGYNGFIIPVHDEEALADKMTDIINRKINIQILSQNAQKEAMRYDIKNVVDRKILIQLGLETHE